MGQPCRVVQVTTWQSPLDISLKMDSIYLSRIASDYRYKYIPFVLAELRLIGRDKRLNRSNGCGHKTMDSKVFGY